MFRATVRTEDSIVVVFGEDRSSTIRNMIYVAVPQLGIEDGRFRLDNIAEGSFPSVPSGPIRLRYELTSGDRKYQVLVLVSANRLYGRMLSDLDLAAWLEAVEAYLPEGRRKLLLMEYFPAED